MPSGNTVKKIIAYSIILTSMLAMCVTLALISAMYVKFAPQEEVRYPYYYYYYVVLPPRVAPAPTPPPAIPAKVTLVPVESTATYAIYDLSKYIAVYFGLNYGTVTDIEIPFINGKLILYLSKYTIIKVDGVAASRFILRIEITPREKAPITPDVVLVSDAYLLKSETPGLVTFSKPVKISIKYEEKLIPRGYSEKDLVVMYYDEVSKAWIPLTTTVDVRKNVATASTTHLTLFAVGLFKVPEVVEIGRVTLWPNYVKTISGVETTIYAKVVDTAGLPVADRVVHLYVDNVYTMTSTTNASGIAVFKLVLTEVGSHSAYAMANGVKSNLITIDVKVKDPPELMVAQLLLTADKTVITLGERVLLTVKALTSEGYPVPDVPISIIINGKQHGQVVTDERGKAVLEFKPEKAGKYSITARFEDHESSLEVIVKTPPAPSVGIPVWLVIAVINIIIIIVVVFVIALIRRRRTYTQTQI